MNTELNTNKLGEAVLQKFVNEEIMTRSELDSKLDAVMQKYTKHIDAKFEVLDNKFEVLDNKFELLDNKIDSLRIDVDKRFEQVDRRFEQVDRRYGWVIGLIVSSAIALGSLILRTH